MFQEVLDPFIFLVIHVGKPSPAQHQHRRLSCPTRSPALGSKEPKETGACNRCSERREKGGHEGARHLGAWAAEAEDFEDGVVRGFRSHRDQERGTESGDWAKRLPGE